MTMQVKKEAAEALAHLMVGEAEFPYSKLVLEALPKGLKVIALPWELLSSLYHILWTYLNHAQIPRVSHFNLVIL